MVPSKPRTVIPYIGLSPKRLPEFAQRYNAGIGSPFAASSVLEVFCPALARKAGPYAEPARGRGHTREKACFTAGFSILGFERRLRRLPALCQERRGDGRAGPCVGDADAP